MIINESVQINSSLAVQSLTGATRASIAQETLKAYDLPLTNWRIHDAFETPLPSLSAASAGVLAVSYNWDVNSADDSFFVSNRDWRVVGITARVEVAGTDGGAVTATIKKAASATDIASGTALHSSTINLKGTVDTNQALTLSTTQVDADIPAGTAIGIDFTGTLTAARGVVTVFLAPWSPDDMQIVTGTFGTGLPYLASRNLDATVTGSATLTYKARQQFTLPPEYKDGTDVTLRFAAGMLTAIASVSALVDAQVYVSGRDTTIDGSDLVSTAATSMNSLTFAEKSFTVSGAGLVSGSVLDILISLIGTSATASSHFAAIAHTEALLTIQG